MNFENAVWNFERIFNQFLSDGDLDIELIVLCMKKIEDSSDK
jgi:hypothetical protein